MKILEHRENPFPENPEDRLDAVLNVGNTGLKDIILLHLDKIPRDCSKIKSSIEETIGQNLPTTAQSFYYCCHKTLYNFGMVAEEDILQENPKRIVVGFRLTKAGIRYGQPIAALKLDYAVRNNLDMYQILRGIPSKGNKRSPLNRVKILEALKDTSLHVSELERQLGLSNSAVLRHLKSLRKIGFISFDYDPVKFYRGMCKYRWTGKKEVAKISSNRKMRTEKIAATLKEHKVLDRWELSKLSGYGSVEDISRILAELERKGVIEKESTWKIGEPLLEASISNKGRRFLSVLDRINGCLSDTTSLNDFYFDLIHSKEFRKLSRKAYFLYRKTSPYADPEPMERNLRRTLSIIRANPGITLVELANKAAIDHRTVNRQLKLLSSSREIIKEKDSRIVGYYTVG